MIWYRARNELRATWRSVAVLALLAGIGGGVAMTAVAGARRTDAAMPAFLASTLPDDGGVLFGSDPSTPPPMTAGEAGSLAPPLWAQPVLRLPQVAAWGRSPYLFMTTDPSGRGVGALNVFGAADAQIYRTVDRLHVVAGRLPDPRSPSDVSLNELAARRLHLGVGSSVRLYAYAPDQFAGGQLTGGSGTGPQARPAGPLFTVRVAAIVRLPLDVSAIVPLAARQQVDYEGQENLYLTPAFLSRYADAIGTPVEQVPAMNGFAVRLRRGARDWRAFSASARAVSPGLLPPQQGNAISDDIAAASAQRGIHLEVVALYVFGALAALVTLLLAGQALAREVTVQGEDYATLRSLGATRWDILGVVALRAAVVGLVGAVLAVVVAVAASPLTPIGLARRAEIHPGVRVDPVVLGAGFVVLGLLVTCWSLVAAWRLSGRPAEVEAGGIGAQPARTLAGLLRRSPAAQLGVWFGLHRGRGRSAVPVGTAMVGAIAAVAALAAAVTFAASLDHLVRTPSQQGWNWDVLVGNPNGTADQEPQGDALLRANPLVGSYSAIAVLPAVSVGGVPLPTGGPNGSGALFAFDPLRGRVLPPLLEGRAPATPREIVLGAQTLKRTHRRVGETVNLETGKGAFVSFRVVGRMVSPSVGDILTNNVGQGAWVSGEVVHQLMARAAADPSLPAPPPFLLFAVRYASGASATAAFASLQRDFGPTVLSQLPAEDAVNLQSVDRLPFLLAGLIVLLGIATIGNALVSFVRRRRHDLAILKMLGFTRGQVAATVAWSATSFAMVALVVGLPVGIAGGRWAWILVGSGIGSVSPPLVPLLALALVAPATVLLSNAVAAAPAWSAARLAPAVVLRSE